MEMRSTEQREREERKVGIKGFEIVGVLAV